MILAITSALHGADRLPKAVLIAASAVLWGILACWITGSMYGWTASIPVIAWWFVLRGGKQARAELDCMDRWNAPHPTYLDVMKAHYFTGFLTVLSLYFFNYDRTPHLVNNGKFWDCRRPTELATGLTGDLMLLLVVIVFNMVGFYAGWVK